MPEFRHDPLTELCAIIATKRTQRPSDYAHSGCKPMQASECPFCEGHEAKTPKEIFALRPSGSKPDGPGWQLRVVPNKYPAVSPSETYKEPLVGVQGALRGGFGIHEVIIETPKHGRELTDLSIPEIVQVIETYKLRLLAQRDDTKLKYTVLFKNVGAIAGASLAHAHSQLVALPFIPQKIKVAMEAFSAYLKTNGSCLMCDLINTESNAHERVVIETKRMIALCPFASQFPFTSQILPKSHQADFTNLSGDDLQDFAEMFVEVHLRLKKALGDVPYNMVIYTVPHSDGGINSFHWRIEFIPRITQPGGFEWGTGVFINSTPPELAARLLKEAG